MTAFLITSTILFALLFLAWKKSGFLNFTIKAGLFGMTAWSLFLTLKAFGYIVGGG